MFDKILENHHEATVSLKKYIFCRKFFVPICNMAECSSVSQCVHSDGLPYTPLALSSVNFPDGKTTHRVYLVDMVDSELFEESISRLMRATKVGLAGKGEALGREGVLSLLVLATEEEEAFVFDILLLGTEGFQYGLYAVLHRPDLVKVVHDVRQLSDILHHQFQVTLVNVFDTMAAHLVVANWEADTPRQNMEVAPSLEDTVRRFLKTPDVEISRLSAGSSQAASITASSRWRLRALPKQLLLEAAVSALLLLPLANLLELKLMEPVNRTSEALLDEVRGLTCDSEAEQAALTPQFNPDSMTVALPLWRRIAVLK